MKELEIKLNKEYKNIGEVSIEEMHEEEIAISNVNYVKSIIDKVTPLKIDTPIVLAKSWRDEYTLIDGYHRLKSKIEEGITSIKAIVLDKYKITRKHDSFFGFVSKLVGSTIKFIDGELMVVDGELYEIVWNEGCGGCSNGWSSIKVVNEYLNKNIVIKTIESKEKSEDEYELFINGKLVAEVDSGYGNGYYGGDFEVFIRT